MTSLGLISQVECKRVVSGSANGWSSLCNYADSSPKSVGRSRNSCAALFSHRTYLASRPAVHSRYVVQLTEKAVQCRVTAP